MLAAVTSDTEIVRVPDDCDHCPLRADNDHLRAELADLRARVLALVNGKLIEIAGRK